MIPNFQKKIKRIENNRRWGKSSTNQAWPNAQKNLRRRQNNYLDFITPLKIMELSGLEFKNIQISCMLNIFFISKSMEEQLKW